MGPSVKSVSRPMASTTTKILTKKFHFPTGLWRGGGSGPLHSKRLWKRAFFFFAAFPKLMSEPKWKYRFSEVPVYVWTAATAFKVWSMGAWCELWECGVDLSACYWPGPVQDQVLFECLLLLLETEQIKTDSCLFGWNNNREVFAFIDLWTFWWNLTFIQIGRIGPI